MAKEKQIQEEITKQSLESKNVFFRDVPIHREYNTRVRMRNLNNNPKAPTFARYTKQEIAEFIGDPYANEKQIRNAVIYLYGASSHFRRLIQYFVGLTDLAYIVAPYRVDTSKPSTGYSRKNFIKTCNIINSMDLENQGFDILTTCLREDVYYCTMWIGPETITLQRLPSDYCKIATVEDNVFNVTFDFGYFDLNKTHLDMFPDEFRKKYGAYQLDRKQRWIELDAPTSFAIKANKDIPNYPLPPFAGILTNLYDIADYQALKLTRTEIENYALIAMNLKLDANGNYIMGEGEAEEYFRTLENVLPDGIGAIHTPFGVEKVDFPQSGGTSSADRVAEAESHLMSAAGVSSQIFSSKNTQSANSMLLSIKADQAITYNIVRSIESAINRYLWTATPTKYFKISFLDCSPFNREEVRKAAKEGFMYGAPTISMYCASLGINQMDMDSLNFLEDTILDVKERFKPLESSNTMSGDAGAPEADIGDLSDEGEKARERL